MFQIVELCTTGQTVPIIGTDGNPILFSDGRTAAVYCNALKSERGGGKFQPRRLVNDDAWRDRETSRFADGSYKMLPWITSWWWRESPFAEDHYAHVSVDDPGKIAFTESPEKGAADIQTRMRAGRYLTRFFSEILSADEIREWSLTFATEHECNVVLFAETADEIEEVYDNGPKSCMSDHDTWPKRSQIKPVRVYAAGDLSVAYLKVKSETSERIVARSVVWRAKNIYSRIYGDEFRLGKMLQEMGYDYGAPIGAKLLKVPLISKTGRTCNDSFVLPYIDASSSSGGGALDVTDCGDYFKICEHGEGEYTGNRTDGLSEVSRDEQNTCPRCDENYDDGGDFSYVEDAGEAWCEQCCDNDTYTCDGNDNRYSLRGMPCFDIGCYTISRRFFRQNYGYECSNCENHFLDTPPEGVRVVNRSIPRSLRYQMHHGVSWCSDCFDEGGFTCEATDACCSNEELVTLFDGSRWSREHFVEHGVTCRCGNHFRRRDLSEDRRCLFCPNDHHTD